MKLSCNGCRVLRKGCSDSCTIRPCLQWIKSPESQANATVFLAKFYGRAGLLNLINGGPDHLRPVIFRSLLYEACGRVVNPIYGSVGLLCSGSWHLCQAAVEAVLSGAPVAQIPSETAAAAPVLHLKDYDIRHVGKDQHDAAAAASTGAAAELHNVSRTVQTKFKRSGLAPAKLNYPAAMASVNEMEEFWRVRSRESYEKESLFSAETAEASHVSQAEPVMQAAEESGVELELTLWYERWHPAARAEAEQ
ncbi:putative LOB domain-containing protein 40 [Iris pallida]|uniref:LOB domain-containing protein 40 n=1 Tax=Iris pallida TaxID=29817 RepID=A0AAX6DVQ5_IRIPA|nr:putative LOB domain-containing protein 40 [Iris pallida]